MQELLDEDMPDLPEFQAPQEQSDISIELQFPSGIADVSLTCTHTVLHMCTCTCIRDRLAAQYCPC